MYFCLISLKLEVLTTISWTFVRPRLEMKTCIETRKIRYLFKLPRQVDLVEYHIRIGCDRHAAFFRRTVAASCSRSSPWGVTTRCGRCCHCAIGLMGKQLCVLHGAREIKTHFHFTDQAMEWQGLHRIRHYNYNAS